MKPVTDQRTSEKTAEPLLTEGSLAGALRRRERILRIERVVTMEGE